MTHASSISSSAPGSTRHRVLITSRSFGRYCPEAVERLRAAGCELIPNETGRAPSEQELIAQITDVDVLVAGAEPISARVLAAANRLKGIVRHGIGYDNIDVDAARSRGIRVAVSGNTVADSVADMAMGLLLALARRIPEGDQLVRRGGWSVLVGVELRGKTLGVVGLGRVGKELCSRARGFGLNVIAYDAFPDERLAQTLGVRYLPLDELLSAADFVSLHVPLTPENHHMINATTLALMRPTAYLINTAQGHLVDEQALAEALRARRLAGAASDVFQHEPPGEHPLLLLDNFIATPHAAAQTYDSLRRTGATTAENVLRILAGELPLYEVL